MKGKKLIFAFILALIVCVALIPLCAYAEGDEGGEQGETQENIQENTTVEVATYDTADGIGTAEYDSNSTDEGANKNASDALTAAVNSVEDGGTITLLNDTTGYIFVNQNKTITIDLNQKTLTGNPDTYNIAFQSFGGNITIKNGTINGDIDVYDSSTVTLESNVIVNGMVVVWGDGTYGQAGCKTPTVNIYGTVSNTKDQAVSTNGTDRSSATINVYDGAVISSKESCGIFLPSGRLNVYGGSITGATGIYSKGGAINISGGTITGTLSPAAEPDFNNNNGCRETGSAITIEHAENGGYPVLDPKDVSINGGTFISRANKAIMVYTRNASQTPATGFITSGIFSSDPTIIYNIANGKDASYVKAGVEVKYIDGLWYVGSSIPVETVEETVVAQVEPVITNTVEAVVEGTSTVSLAANEEVVIKLNLTVAADSTSGEAVEVTSVVVNGVEVEFTIAEDGSVVLSPEVLAALGPGTHTIYILTSEGWVKVTITITE